jgi:hypothetical protein
LDVNLRSCLFAIVFFGSQKYTSGRPGNHSWRLSFGESSLYILEGNIESEGNLYTPKHILIAKDSKLCHFTLKPDSTVYIFGGEPFPNPDISIGISLELPEIIEDAKTRWQNHEFPKVINDDGYVPLPPQNKNIKLKE